MACFHPLTAYQLWGGGQPVFSEPKDYARKLELPCGQCSGCRLERSRQWAVRCVNEAQLHDKNCFITLTYSDEYVPRDNSLVYGHFQKFMKRLVKKMGPTRYYVAGEYGEETKRPHYHAILFGQDFNDKLYWRLSEAGFKLYRSATLEKLWTFGHSEIGTMTFETAAYTARYCMKKVTGQMAAKHYMGDEVDTVTGEISTRTPEFNHMSLKPGIGANWLSTYEKDVYPHGMIVINGKEVRPPRYYDKKYQEKNPDRFEELSMKREAEGVKRKPDNTPERLAVREEVQLARIRTLKRTIK